MLHRMLHRWWRRSRHSRQLSEYVDDELGWEDADRVSERLVFDPEARQELLRMRAVDELVERVLAPPSLLPDAHQAADQLVARVNSPATVRPSPIPKGRSLWTPAIVASLGILLTAGVAFAGLKRRGLV